MLVLGNRDGSHMSKKKRKKKNNAITIFAIKKDEAKSGTAIWKMSKPKNTHMN